MAASWPALTYQSHFWEHRDPLASRRSQKRNRGYFQAPVLPCIAEEKPDLPADVQARALEASNAMARFDQTHQNLGPFPFASVLLRGESATSSQIENLTVSARKISLASIGAPIGGNAQLVARNVSSMQAAIRLASDLSPQAILDMHLELTRGIQVDAGHLRQEWVWVGGQSPVTATFVGPAWQDLPDLLEDLTAFLRRKDLDPTVQAAIAHAQFETIHPFTDGNGRTGRALISALLRSRGVTRDLIIPISSGLLHDIDRYISALESYRSGDIVPIVECFIDAIETSLENTRILAEDIENYYQQILASRSRVTNPIRQIASFCCTEPAFTAAMIEDSTGIAKSTIYRILAGLVDLRLLREEEKIRGQQTWSSPALTGALDEFSRRAGRRRFT